MITRKKEFDWDKICRYFIISIIRKDKNSNMGYSDMSMQHVGGYINRKDFIKSMHGDYGFTEVVILNIVEITKSDYENYNL
jgi:hypothetical protein